MTVLLRYINSVTLLFICFLISGQVNETITWRGIVVNQSNGEPVPNAVVAVYRQVMMYSADENGVFRIALLPADSVRVAALGFQAATFSVKEVIPDSEGWVSLKLHPVSYTLKEVKVKGYRGMLDPMFFPKLTDDVPRIELNLPSYIGSKMSKTSPSEQLLMKNPSPLAALASPISFGYSLFSKHEKSLRNLAIAKVESKSWLLHDAFASRETIAIFSGFEGDELDAFVIYCNINLKISSFDNGASVAAKIKILLDQFKIEQERKEISLENL